MRARLVIAFQIVSLVLLPARGEAQALDDRRAMAAFRDSIAAARDTSALRTLESAMMLTANRDRSNPRLHLSLGYLALRLGDYSDAAAEFKWSTQLAPDWPLAWFAWGRAELSLGDEVETATSTRRLRLARDAWSRAARAFGRAVVVDTDFVAETVALAATVLAGGRRDWAGVIRDGFRRAGATTRGARSVAVMLGLGRTERLVGDTALAAAAFKAVAELNGGRAMGLLELARTRLTAGDRQGIQPYFTAAALDDSTAVLGLRRDLASIASEVELRAIDASAGEARARVLWDFWTGRDRTELRANGERLVEHYRRLAVQAARYPDPDDLRGTVLVRHGEPDAQASLRDPGIVANESWWYRRPDGDFVVHFAARTDTTRFTLVDSIFDLLDSGLAVGGAGTGDEAAPGVVDPERLLRSRASLSPFFQAAVDGRRRPAPEFRTRERLLGREGKRIALTTDRYPLRFERDLAARIRVAAVYGPIGPEARAFVAVPRFALGDSAPASVTVRVRIVARDTGGRTIRALDTTVVITPTADSSALVGSVGIPLPPGFYETRVAIGYAGRSGTLVSRSDLRMPGAEPGALALYDVLLAGDRPPLVWTPLADSVVGVDPRPVLGRSETLDVYGSVTGLAAAGRGRARLLVRPVAAPDEKPKGWGSFPGASGWVDVSFEPDRAGVAAVRLGVPLRRLERGAYEVELVVVDASGRTARHRARIEVEDR